MGISTITGHRALAEVRFGSNGDLNAFDAEYRVGEGNGTWQEGRRTWDADLSDGLWSDSVDTTFIANPGGGTSGIAWSVIGGVTDPLSLTGVTYGAITSVKLRAAVTGAGMRMRWSSVLVNFYKNGTLQQRRNMPPSQWPDANTLSLSVSDPVERILTVTPSASDNDMVVITASVALTANTGIALGAGHIFGQIFLFAS
jgi:hypothetical protein